MNPKENEQFITCTNCGEKIQLTQALMTTIEADLKKKYQEEYEAKIKAREKKVRDDTEKVVIEKYETSLHDLQNQVDEKNKKLKDLNKRELELNKKERELAEKESGIQLKVDEQVKSQILIKEKKIKEDTEKSVIAKYETNVKDLENEISEKDKKIKEFNK
ncbi:MAG TPA: hypothetical protein VJ954_02060, partial [Ignavibacteriaceae bacterium]|nr:hypothetical protein [Ignavibacteriaceae bacterium]